MKTSILVTATALLSLSGCATVPLADAEKSTALKQFDIPPVGKSSIYIYRDSAFGGALKKDIWVNDNCLGESAPYVFFHTLVDSEKEVTVATESQFSPNQLKFYVKDQEHYFVRQYIKPGLFVGGANLESVETSKGKVAIKDLDLAKSGNCS